MAPVEITGLSHQQLARPFRTAVFMVLAFGGVMLLMLVMAVTSSQRVLDSGVAPMQELVMMERLTSQALERAKQQLPTGHNDCHTDNQAEICEVPHLMRSVAGAAQRLLDGEGGLAGMPRSRQLEGEARGLALQLRDGAARLQTVHADGLTMTAGSLLGLQRDLMQIHQVAYRLEQAVLAQLRKELTIQQRLDLLAITATGVLMAAAVLAMFWMWARVRSAFDRLHASEARLRAYADAVPDPAYILDAHGVVLENLGHSALPDRPPPIPVGDPVSAHRAPAMAERIVATISAALESRGVQSLSTQVADMQGRLRWFEARVAPIEAVVPVDEPPEPSARPAPDRVLWISRDVTRHIETEQALRVLNEQLEHRVEERTRELHDAAEELRRFNYTVSHDLRAPLRAVEAYMALALEEAGSCLQPGARDLLERARKSAHQLAHMVESLLNLSRIGEMPVQRTWLDLSGMARDICMAFAVDQKERHLQWEVAPDMSAWADEHLVRSVLQNLINNAVKYSAGRDPARIEVGAVTQDDGTTVFHVRDNGAGFDMARANQLFQPFTRLHSAREFPGDGIGLATVRRIVLRHGGRIWAQGQVDVGATIYFTLPGQPAQQTGSASPPVPGGR